MKPFSSDGTSSPFRSKRLTISRAMARETSSDRLVSGLNMITRSGSECGSESFEEPACATTVSNLADYWEPGASRRSAGIPVGNSLTLDDALFSPAGNPFRCPPEWQIDPQSAGMDSPFKVVVGPRGCYR